MKKVQEKCLTIDDVKIGQVITLKQEHFPDKKGVIISIDKKNSQVEIHYSFEYTKYFPIQQVEFLDMTLEEYRYLFLENYYPKTLETALFVKVKTENGWENGLQLNCLSYDNEQKVLLYERKEEKIIYLTEHQCKNDNFVQFKLSPRNITLTYDFLMQEQDKLWNAQLEDIQLMRQLQDKLLEEAIEKGFDDTKHYVLHYYNEESCYEIYLNRTEENFEDDDEQPDFSVGNCISFLHALESILNYH